MHLLNSEVNDGILLPNQIYNTSSISTIKGTEINVMARTENLEEIFAIRCTDFDPPYLHSS